MTKPGVRDLQRRLEDSEAAARELRANKTRAATLLEVDGPVSRLLRVYVDLADAALPLRSRDYETPGRRSRFGAPLPYLSTELARGALSRLNRVLAVAAVTGEEVIEGTDSDRRGVSSAVLEDLCGRCGCDGTCRSRNLAARRRTAEDAARAFLIDLLADGPVASETVRRVAAEHGISHRTLRRVSEPPKGRNPRLVIKNSHGWQLAPEAAENWQAVLDDRADRAARRKGRSDEVRGAS